ncbi:MAG: serine hydrolase [Ignavibacteria bacterium]|nr:serine hydrolase [Ignavibacteria bacterium]
MRKLDTSDRVHSRLEFRDSLRAHGFITQNFNAGCVSAPFNETDPPHREAVKVYSMNALSMLRLLLVTALCLPCLARSQSFDPQLASRLQSTLDSMRVAQNVKGISASVLLPGQGLWQGTSGVSHATVRITPDMEFGIGSNSKLFTAVTLLKLVENGLLSLDDSLHAWLPSFRNIDSTITIRQILNHTSGIADVNDIQGYPDSILSNPLRVFTREEVLGWVGPPHFRAGTSWSYSNTNYILAGMIVEHASGKRLARFLRDSVLAPLRLDSTFLPIEELVSGSIAHPWANDVEISGTPRVSLLTTAWSAGAMYSTSSEMAQWYAALMSGRVLQEESFRQMTTFVGSGNYGFGISEKTVAGRLLWLHGGSIRGYSSQMMYDTALKTVICVLINATPAPAALVAQQLLLTLVNSPITDISEIGNGVRSIDIYPNPSRSLFTIRAAVPTDARITDILGRELWRGRIEGTWTVDAASWSAGVYLLFAGKRTYRVARW